MKAQEALIFSLLCSFARPMLGGERSYHVTLNAHACHEVNLGRFGVPLQSKGLMDAVENGHCHYQVRSGPEAELYIGVVCVGYGPVPGQGNIWPSAPQKFAVELSRPPKVRRIDEAAWISAPILERTEGGGAGPDADGLHYKGHLFEKSGPSWYGKGIPDQVPTHFGPNYSRVAVNSWDGIDETHDILDAASLFERNHVKGNYWIDIYDTTTAEPLTRITGSFNGAEPVIFLREDTFYSDRYYLMEVGHANGAGLFSLRDVLICDLDAAAARKDTLKERK